MRPSTRPTAARVTAMSAATERTLVLVKPDGVRRGLVGAVLRRVEDKGYRITALQMRTAGPDLLKEHYAEHAGKSFFGPLVEFMSSGPVGSGQHPRRPGQRPGDDGHPEHRARLGLAGLRRARDHPVVPRPVSEPFRPLPRRTS